MNIKLKNLLKGYTQCEIYFHIDMDGVTTALATKEYFKRYYNIETINAHVIQYGALQFSVPKAKDGVLPILVDFASGRSMFKIQFDHHQEQRGASEYIYAKAARSNVEVISGELSPSDIFIYTDILSIQTIDSANFSNHNINLTHLHNSDFKIDHNVSYERNRFLLTFATNRLLLSFKNKRINFQSYYNKNLLECLVLDSNPSIYSIYNNILKYMKGAISIEYNMDTNLYDKLIPLATKEDLSNNLIEYFEKRQDYLFDQNTNSMVKNISIGFDKEYKIIKQFDVGETFKSGGYDRYIPFKVYPDSEYIVTMYSMGLIQVSQNPFNKNGLHIDISELAEATLDEYKDTFSKILIPLAYVKQDSESMIRKLTNKNTDDYCPVGFTYEDLYNYYKTSVYYQPDRMLGDTHFELLDLEIEGYSVIELKRIMNKYYNTLSKIEQDELMNVYVPLWTIVKGSSGGHKSITNISSLHFLQYNQKQMMEYYNTSDYISVMKNIANSMADKLKVEIKNQNNLVYI